MEAAKIAQIIDEMGTLLELRGENPFRVRAYHTAAQALVNVAGDLPEMITDGRLKEVPGIGDTMYAKIVQLATTGQLPSYDELRRSTPPGLVALLRIPGLGPKKIKALHETLKI
jgi:DNA polymerase (family 10)